MGRFRNQLDELGLRTDLERVRYQHDLLGEPGHPRLRGFIMPLIEDMLDHYAPPEPLRTVVKEAMIAQIDVAARLYVESGRHKPQTYQFAAYFTWFAKEAAEDILSREGAL